MEINYIDYSADLFETAIDNTKPKVYIFANHASKLAAKDYYQRPFLEQESLFLMMAELKEKLFPSDRLLLKEEKLVILFYELLTAEDKRRLKINNYNDAIDLANQFFNFYHELAEYKIDKIEGLNGWQQEKYDIFQRLRKRCITKMEELNYSDRRLNYKVANFNPGYFNDFVEIVFVNILNFTPLEKELLSKLEGAGYTVRLYNQISPADYDEQDLELKSVTLPDELDTELEIYQTNEELLQLVAAFSKVEQVEDNYTILDADFENNNYHNLLSSTKVKIDQDVKFTRTKLYRFLETLYTLLKNADSSKGELRLWLEDVVEASYLTEFRDYYDLGKEELAEIEKLAQNDYLYLSQELIDEELIQLEAILNEIEQLSKLGRLTEFCSYLEGMELEKLIEEQYKDDLAVFISGLAELVSIEEMEIIDSWSQYFSNTAQGLFLLILNYFKFKPIKRLVGDEQAGVEIKDLLASSFINRDKIIFLNLAEGILPKKEEANFLLTTEQRERLGLKVHSQRRLEMKYKFFRHLLSSKQVVIFTLKSEARNIAISSFIEELKVDYNLEEKDVDLGDGNYPQIIKSIFNCNADLLGLELARNSDRLKIEAEDFPDQKLSLGYYKYSCLKECSYKFYLKYIGQLEDKRAKFDNKLSKKVLGILVHRVFAKIVDREEAKFKSNDFKVDNRIIRKVLEEELTSFDLKIPRDYENYYRDVLFKAVQDSIAYFLSKVNQRLDSEVIGVLSEWAPDREEREVFLASDKLDIWLSGRIDLMIETEDEKYLIDYKTGGGDTKQLDFYALLCDFEAKETINKQVYQVMEKKFNWVKSGSEEKFAEKLTEVLKERLINSEEYKAEFKSRCRRCNYLDICKVGSN
ncbi:PD-(D/E)XK nuclease family protein [Natroniella sp. ANB-PHB2]|uniref:PD-(D/E)XK nuclease family protein n=1 Tax=Natroniella sp. ANB-PHB2 TaxID=3384444 RepID=UPI0038D42667